MVDGYDLDVINYADNYNAPDINMWNVFFSL